MTHLNRYRLLSSLMTLMAVIPLEAQTTSGIPRLVVNIIVDQLRTDYMEAFIPLYGEDGFKRLLREGKVYRQAEYPFSSPDRASAVATLLTGTTPRDHGVVGERWLNRETLQPHYCVDDKSCMGLLTPEQSSPACLTISTLTDELKVATQGKALVYGISPYRDAAILSAGHAADFTFWIDDLTGQWCGTDYYGMFPQWALTYNNGSDGLKKRISSLKWEPALTTTAHYFVSDEIQRLFKHTFTGERKVRDLKESVLVNDEVNRFAGYCLQQAPLGVDDIPDFLSLTYYAGNYLRKGVDECPLEMQDTYVRLDRQLAECLRLVEEKVGKDKVLFVLTSTGYVDEHLASEAPYRIPSGTFNITRAQLLLNMYLIAVYGQGQYVETAWGNELYLNHKLLESRAMNVSEVLMRCQDFLIQLAGVRDVLTTQRLLQGAGNPRMERLHNASHPKVSGDLIIQVVPGWHLINDNTHEDRISRESYMGFPLIFLGPEVRSESVTTPVTIDRVAPTVSRHLKIRAPNGCSAAPL